MSQKTKYCRAGCGRRLVEAVDGPYWRADNRCLACRLDALFQAHARAGSRCLEPQPVESRETWNGPDCAWARWTGQTTSFGTGEAQGVRALFPKFDSKEVA